MLSLRKAADRGHANHGWLDSHHSFSFASYHDPAHMGFGNLRVINEDRIAPGSGFGTHGHRDMEIISYVLSGELAHKDDLLVPQTPAASAPRGGTSALGLRAAAPGPPARAWTASRLAASGGERPGDRRATAGVQVIRPGDVQRMSAGRGVMHSESNHAPNQTTHFLQIWIEPQHRGIDPGYEQKHFADADKRGRLRLLASNDGRDGSVTMNADAALYAGLFDGDEAASLVLDPARKAYVHLVRGRLRVNGVELGAGDAAKLSGVEQLNVDRGHGAEVLVFDLAT